MVKAVRMTELKWDLVLQSIHHRMLQTENPDLKAQLKEIEDRIDVQLRDGK